MKNGDVFCWQYKDHEAYLHRHRSSSTAYWCLDRQCVYWEGVGLVDTYWAGLAEGYFSSAARYINENEVDLAFVCNLEDVEFIHKSAIDEYDKVYTLSHQHNSYPCFAIDRGAEKSKTAVLAKKERELADVKSELEYLQRKIVWLAEEIKELSQ